MNDALMSGLVLAADGRQSQAASEIARGTARTLLAHGLVCVTEMPLANGRRADLVAICDRGEIAIVEVKSCLADFRADAKWPEYLDYCDRLYFAVAPSFPVDVLSEETGLIVADRYGGEIVRDAPLARLVPARRKAMTLAFARCAAARLGAGLDPDWRSAFGAAASPL